MIPLCMVHEIFQLFWLLASFRHKAFNFTLHSGDITTYHLPNIGCENFHE